MTEPDTHTVWAVASDTLYCGWQAGTVEHDGKTYADVYPTQREAEVEVADMILERLQHFIQNADAYVDLADALDPGFEAVEAQVESNGNVYIDDDLLGQAPPTVREYRPASRSLSSPDEENVSSLTIDARPSN